MDLPKLTVAAPAKVNLHLAVFDKRPDGFHNLESIFLAVGFGDTLYFEPISGEKTLKLTMEGSAATGFDLPVEKNIIFRALSLFRDKTGFAQGLKIKVEKRIPPGGGLGGGSSDAAATLLALNKLAGFPLGREQLLEMAAALGSDVPFFIYETAAARVTGRGECVEPLEAPCWFFVLVNPGFPSDTAAAFRLLDEYRKLTPNFVTQRRKDAEENKRFAEWSFGNDFLPVFKEPEKSVYDGIISRLRELGAEFASLSGTGSTCFGLFRERLLAEKAAAVLCGTEGKYLFSLCTCINGPVRNV
jgi:4-diphosphocytidyl-2-C-methyl-D-erythritol kinase